MNSHAKASSRDIILKQYHQDLYNTFYKKLKIDNDALESEDDTLFVKHLSALSTNINSNEDGQPLGQLMITACIARYPHITVLIPRDLFWYFGNECLHYVDEAEISCFQALEEAFYELSKQKDVTLDDYHQLRQTHFPVSVMPN